MEEHEQLLADTLQILQNFINETPEFSKYLSDTITKFYKSKVEEAIKTINQMQLAYIFELGRAKEVSGKVASLKNEIQQLNKRNKTLTEENKVLSKNFQRVNKVLASLQSFQKQAVSSENSLAAEKAKVSLLEQSLAQLRDELAIAQSTMSNIQEKNETSIIENAAYKKEFRALKQENMKLSNTLAIQNRSIEKINELMEGDSKIKAENDKLKIENKKLKSLYGEILRGKNKLRL